MEYLIRLVQVHESFRRPEIEALAMLANFNVEFVYYAEYVRSDPACTSKVRHYVVSESLSYLLECSHIILVTILYRQAPRRGCR